jgi:DNA-binding LacI/PurR family transcriptional regulator
VSKSSVSNYLNGKDERLGEATKARIRDAAERLNYSPSLGARRLSTKSASRTIGAVIRHDLGYMFRTRYFTEVMAGIGEACGQLGYRVILVSSLAGRPSEDIEYALSLSRGIVDGFLLFELEENDPYVAAFERSQVPYVCYGRPEDESLSRWVSSDHEGGVAAAVEHLWGHGHRRMALFPGLSGSLIASRRAAGFRDALARLGASADEFLVRYGYSAEADLYPEYLRILSLGAAGPTALVFPQAHLGAYARALEAAGRAASPPAVVLADYFPSDEYETTPYAYLRGHIRQVGLRGAVRLIDGLEGRPVGQGEFFPTELIAGTSCGCGRGA